MKFIFNGLARNKISIILTVLFLGAVVTSYYFYDQHQKDQKLLSSPTSAIKEQTKTLVGKVGRLIELPKNEDPTLATVTDRNKLKDQPFFANSQNGDQLLIYTKAKKAILYRPGEDKVIEVAPVNIGDNTSQVAGTSQVQSVKVALYNGTSTSGLTNTIETQLKTKITNIDVVVKDNSSKKDYAKTLIIDLTGKGKEIAGQLAQVLNANVVNLPDGEAKPVNGDFLIILGKDQVK